MINSNENQVTKQAATIRQLQLDIGDYKNTIGFLQESRRVFNKDYSELQKRGIKKDREIADLTNQAAADKLSINELFAELSSQNVKLQNASQELTFKNGLIKSQRTCLQTYDRNQKSRDSKIALARETIANLKSYIAVCHREIETGKRDVLQLEQFKKENFADTENGRRWKGGNS